MSASTPSPSVTLRGVLGRRRIGSWSCSRRCRSSSRSSFRLGGGARDGRHLDNLVVRTVLPLVALVFGTAALGSELEDGTSSTCSRSRSGAGGWSSPRSRRGGADGGVRRDPGGRADRVIVGGTGSSSREVIAAFAVAVLAGRAAYAAAFTTLGAYLARPIVGLAYTLLWEGVLAGLLRGDALSVHPPGTLGIAAALDAARIPASSRSSRSSRSRSSPSRSSAHSADGRSRCSASRRAAGYDARPAGRPTLRTG